jgi:hypothetical protein
MRRCSPFCALLRVTLLGSTLLSQQGTLPSSLRLSHDWCVVSTVLSPHSFPLSPSLSPLSMQALALRLQQLSAGLTEVKARGMLDCFPSKRILLRYVASFPSRDTLASALEVRVLPRWDTSCLPRNCAFNKDRACPTLRARERRDGGCDGAWVPHAASFVHRCHLGRWGGSSWGDLRG